MTNEAYKWLSEWLDKGGWYLDSDDGVWGVFLGLAQFSQSQPDDTIGFRDDMRQLLADAEAGRKLRETTKSYSNIFGVCSEGDEIDEEMLANLNRLDGK